MFSSYNLLFTELDFARCILNSFYAAVMTVGWAVVTTFPPILISIALQRYITAGNATTGLRG